MLFVKIYRTNVPNAALTLARKVPVAQTFEQIRSPNLRAEFSKLLANKEVNFWDFGVKATPHLNISDSVKIICGATCYSGKVIDKIADPSGSIGDLLGWARQFDTPWRNISALDIQATEHITSDKIGRLINDAETITNTFYLIRELQHPRKQEALIEGNIVELTLTVYERNQVARKACIEHFGSKCQACGFDFGAVYGELGMGFIHVHHTMPLSRIREDYRVDPLRDLIPVCPNCHAMIHIRQGEPLSVEQLKEIIGKRKA